MELNSPCGSSPVHQLIVALLGLRRLGDIMIWDSRSLAQIARPYYHEATNWCGRARRNIKRLRVHQSAERVHLQLRTGERVLALSEDVG